MANKKKAVSSESPSPLAPLPVGEGDRTPAPAEEGLEKEYEVKKWAGKDLFVCKFCKFDTFNERRMLEHLVEKHISESAFKKYFEG